MDYPSGDKPFCVNGPPLALLAFLIFSTCRSAYRIFVEPVNRLNGFDESCGLAIYCQVLLLPVDFLAKYDTPVESHTSGFCPGFFTFFVNGRLPYPAQSCPPKDSLYPNVILPNELGVGGKR